MPVNPFETYSPGPSGSAVGSFAITPSNGADLPSVVRAVVVGAAGTIRWRGLDGQVNDTGPLPAGLILPIQTRQIMATGTTASDLTGLV